MVFQSYALYPHMTVAQNIAFPLEMVKLPARRDRSRGAGRRRARSASTICCSASPASCRAASSSAARWRARSCASRACSCSTSRCPTSTPSCAWRRALELQEAAALARRHHRLRHPRPGRGDDAGRPHRGLHGRRHRAGRHAARSLRETAIRSMSPASSARRR